MFDPVGRNAYAPPRRFGGVELRLAAVLIAVAGLAAPAAAPHNLVDDARDYAEALADDPTGPATDPVAFGLIELDVAGGSEATVYNCGQAKQGPPEHHACGPEAEDADVDGSFTITVDLINLQYPEQERWVTVAAYEDGTEIARKAVYMETGQSVWQVWTYYEICDCYLPHGVDVDHWQDWIVDLPVADGTAGHSYEVVTHGGPTPSVNAATDAAYPSDRSGVFAVR